MCKNHNFHPYVRSRHLRAWLPKCGTFGEVAERFKAALLTKRRGRNRSVGSNSTLSANTPIYPRSDPTPVASRDHPEISRWWQNPRRSRARP